MAAAWYTVRNWSRFQHYRDRNPPWIKLHFELLSSADWVALDDASRVLAVASMLLASRNEGRVDLSPDGLAYLQRVAYLNKKPDPKPLIACGFLSPLDSALADASKTLAPASVSVSVSVSEEEKKNTTTRARARAADDFDEFWAAYPKKASKAYAKKCWEKAKGRPPLAEILAALERLKRSRQWTRDNGDFIPNPATWINRGGWDDEPVPAKGAAPAADRGPIWRVGDVDLVGNVMGEDGKWHPPDEGLPS